MANKPKAEQQRDLNNLNAALSEVPAPVIEQATLKTDEEQAAPVEAPKEEPKAAPAPVKMAEVNPQPAKIKCKFENWRFANIGTERHVFGNVEGHPGFVKGEPARSSPVKLYDQKNGMVITEGEIITLGKPASK